MVKFHVTYDIVTPESAENGDTAENGFVDHNGWRYDVRDTNQPNQFDMRLRAAMQLCSPQEDSGRWFSEVDGRDDYRTGGNEIRALHPPRNVTPSSYARLKRLLGVR